MHQHQCHACRHPETLAIDCALLADNHTYKSLTALYGLSKDSLFRHKKWLLKKTAQAEARLKQQQQQETVFLYSQLLEASRRALNTAEAEGNTRPYALPFCDICLTCSVNFSPYLV
jgi:hypothetical protein